MNRISRLGQIKIYVGKCFRLFINEKQWKNFISTFLIMLLICMVTGDKMFQEYTDTNSGGFSIICACIWVGLFNSIQSICKERAIIKREHMTGLHISSYVVSHTIYELFLSSVEALIVVLMVVVKNFKNLPEDSLLLLPVLDLYFTMLLIIFASDTLAMLVSCIVKKEQTAMTVMPFVLIIQLVMAGMIFPLEGITKKISSLTISRWGLNAIWQISNTNDDLYLMSKGGQQSYEFFVQAGKAEDFAPKAGTLIGFWALLALFCIIYIVLAILALERVDKDKR